MHRLRELIRDLFDVEMESLHAIEIQDIDFAPAAKMQIDRTLGEMLSLTGWSSHIAEGLKDPALENPVQCQSFWVERNQNLVLFLWNGSQSKMILLGSNHWRLRNDITFH
ncbi:MAG: hypothetical protein J7M32_12700 [Deltaproteobacteria bacterium]|nr:hypothetical protein [Deltaproteobacteria bacterium]